ncbi:MAG: UDP-N-acetylglucosamine 2-epimerase (non-hydrolyzing) [Oscillospiraceae bacterium]|nr:UDP-N-acetylglucosamine 2-epimerase (non-hydrolyzing) [Oscillospiraceae bacterium]MDD4546946.1 UDP-N-acetylglucosamine 2-epimerase (non-hydrolyzing) [Oscillospiraceae bacterium]
MKKVLIVFGTRPEAIKMCPIVSQLKRRGDIKCVVCVTGQHRQMLKQVLDCFQIIPDHDLQIMKSGQTLSDITERVMSGMEELLKREKPSIVLVHGDTSTTFATALSAFYQQIPIGHVEAGLRTYDIYSPYPEEFNRRAVSIITTMHFAPTEHSRQNLLSEKVPEKDIFVTGNTAIDALRITVRPDYTHEMLEWAKGSRLIMLTAHRRENLGQPLRSMFRAICRIAQDFPDVKVIYPVHLNPEVRAAADEVLANHERIKLIEPLDVLDFHNFMAHAYIMMTDSGGIQEEAPFLGKPVLVMRNTTERPEGISAGTLKMVGTDEEEIYKQASLLLRDKDEYNRMSTAANPYGDGYASERIIEHILNREDIV